MKRNNYPFGATFNKDLIDDAEYGEDWKELFNYAVPENKLKWRANEWTHDKLNFEYSDAMRDLFQVF